MEEIKKAYLKAYDDYADALFRYALFKLHERDMAKDAVQETFMKTWEYVETGNEIRNMKAFLYKTLNRLIIDIYRKKKAVSLDTLAEEGWNPEAPDEEMDRSSDGARALRLLRQIPEPYKEAVFLRYVDELRFSEIASALGESANTVSVRVHRGLKKLQELFLYGKKN